MKRRNSNKQKLNMSKNKLDSNEYTNKEEYRIEEINRKELVDLNKENIKNDTESSNIKITNNQSKNSDGIEKKSEAKIERKGSYKIKRINMDLNDKYWRN